MPDIQFRLTSSGAASVLSSVGDVNAYLATVNRQLESTFRQTFGNIFSGGFGQAGGGFGNLVTQANKVGPAVRSAQIEVDRLNNTLKITGESGLRYLTPGANGGPPISNWLSTGTISTITGNADKWVTAMSKVATAQTSLKDIVKTTNADIAQAESKLASVRASVASKTATPFQSDIQSRTAVGNTLRAEQTRVQDLANFFQTRYGSIPPQLNTALGRIQGTITSNENGIVRATQRMHAAIQASMSDPSIQTSAAGVQSLRSSGAAKLTTERGIIRSLQADARLAWNEASPMPANIAATFAKSPQLQGMLTKAGLQMGDLANTAKFSAPILDLQKNVTRVGGEFAKTTGEVARFSAELDTKSGKVLTRFGGQLSGMGSFLQQIQRDFVKVIEWTIATTVVIGALGAAISSIKMINELDKTLQRFSITAKMTTAQSREYFKTVAETAYNTATPLNEMLGAMDDIALATKRSGQSTQEWTSQITAMGNAVGILTNIGGIKTVEATDALTATMKQLGLQATDMEGILNKVSAVASGQATAISDITKGLSVMAESGKQAGLSIDQQIATVQVLSQVTSKSSSEVATSFKNLVGSIDSAGSIKILKEFGIQVRDAQGNARNFLNIYADIEQAITTGAIPAGRVKEVVKGISGGPRRAPDAAALLANVSTIFDVEKTSVNAANEALLVNAKILESNSAQITKLKVKLDALAFEKFAIVLRTVVEGMSGIIGGIIDLIDKIPSGLLSGVTQILAILAAFKLVGVGIRLIVGLVSSLTGGIIAAGMATSKLATNFGLVKGQVAATAAAGNAGHYQGDTFIPNVTGGGKASGLLGRLRGGAASIATNAVVGAGITAASGGSGLNILGGGLQGAGIGVAMIPGGIPTAVGLGMIAVGTALQFITKEAPAATKELNSNTEAVLANATAYNDAQTSIKTLEAQQASLIQQVDILKSKNDTESIQASSEAKTQLAQVSADLYNANLQLTTSFNDLNTEIAVGNSSGSLGALSSTLLDAIKNGAATVEQIKQIQAELELATLNKAYPGKYFDLTKLGNRPNISLSGNALAVGSSLVSPAQDVLYKSKSVWEQDRTVHQNAVDIQGLSTDKFKSFFTTLSDGTKQLTEKIPRSLTTIGILWGRIDDISKDSPAEAKLYADELERAGLAQDDITKAVQGRVQLEAWLAGQRAIGIISAQKEKDILSNFDFGQKLLSGARQKSGEMVNSPNQGQDYLAGATKMIQDKLLNSNGSALIPGTSDFEGIASLISSINPLFAKWDLPTQIQYMQDLGGNVLYFGKSVQQATVDAEALADAQATLASAGQALNQSMADTSASLYEQYLNGDLTAKQYGELESRMIRFNSAANDINQTLQNTPALDQIASDTLPAWDNMIDKLAKIPGFENAASLSTTDLINKVIAYGSSQNLSSQEAKIWGDLLLWIKGVIDVLPTYKLFTYEIKTVLTGKSQGQGWSGADTNLNAKAQKAYWDKYHHQPYGEDDPNWYRIVSSLAAESPATSNAAGAIPDFTPSLSSWDVPTPTTPKAAKAPKAAAAVPTGSTSTLDIPKEWIDSGQNVQKLLHEAIANAKSLQSSIPGEDKKNKLDLVAFIENMKKIDQTTGIGSEYLRKAMDTLTAEIKKQNDLLTKADTIRRIRVGAGDFAALANVPTNKTSGVSVGSPQGPITVSLNITGQVLTKAQIDQIGNSIAAGLGSQIASG